MWDWSARGGESYPMLQRRVEPWLAALRHDTVVVSHGNVGRVVRGLVLRLDKAAVPRLEAPQDKILHLRDGAGAWI